MANFDNDIVRGSLEAVTDFVDGLCKDRAGQYSAARMEIMLFAIINDEQFLEYVVREDIDPQRRQFYENVYNFFQAQYDVYQPPVGSDPNHWRVTITNAFERSLSFEELNDRERKLALQSEFKGYFSSKLKDMVLANIFHTSLEELQAKLAAAEISQEEPVPANENRSPSPVAMPDSASPLQEGKLQQHG